MNGVKLGCRAVWRAVVLISSAIVALLRRAMTKMYRILPLPMAARQGWLSYETHSVLRGAAKRVRAERAKYLFSGLSYPSWASVLAILLILLTSIAISFLICRCSGDSKLLGQDVDMAGLFGSLWQVQMGVSVVALPILVFIIELARDDKRAVLKSHEVLIRHSWVFPIMVFSLAGTLRIGLDLAFFRNEGVFLLDLVAAFILSLALAIFSYTRALGLLFDPVRMKAKSIEISKERMRRSVDRSVEIRVANHILFSKLAQLGVEYMPFRLDHLGIGDYLVLRSHKHGVLADVHLNRLERFVSGLPRTTGSEPKQFTDAVAEYAESTEKPPDHSEPGILFMKRYGQVVGPEYDGIFTIKSHMFENLDRDTLERQLEDFLVMRPRGHD